MSECLGKYPVVFLTLKGIDAPDFSAACDRLRDNPGAEPDLYWDNSSSNQILRHLIDISDAMEQRDMERLISGETLTKKLVLNLTYDELDKKELLWSILYQTGYLTQEKTGISKHRGDVRLVIPNREIRELFIEKVQDWFAEKVSAGRDTFSDFYEAVTSGDTAKMEGFLNRQLRETISYYDSHEGFYHGFLLGLLRGKGDWAILSNREAGNGRSDIQLGCRDGVTGIVMEVKRAKSREGLSEACEKALAQIEKNAYAEPLYDEGYTTIRTHGVSFYKKQCRVRAGK